MSLYPSLEDMKVDQMARAQASQMAQITEGAHTGDTASAPLPYPLNPTAPGGMGDADVKFSHLYPTLNDYMGLDMGSAEVRAALGPEYDQHSQQIATRSAMPVAVPQTGGMIAPLSCSSVGLRRGYTTHGVREIVVCKDANGKVGLRVHAMNKGVFVVLVQNNSPAALAGLRFGDQILQINGDNVVGYSMDKVHSIFKKADVNGIHLAIRDRPFERSITLHKDSIGHIGFQFKDGKITAIVKDSSAARNGLLTEHNLLEVDGQNVVALNDKEIAKIIDNAGSVVTITIIPSYIYEHMIKSMASSLKKKMDHSVPDL